MIALVVVIGIDFVLVLFLLQMLNPSNRSIGWGTVIASWGITISTSPVFMIGFMFMIDSITQNHGEGSPVWFGLPLGLVVGHALGIWVGRSSLREQSSHDEGERTQTERQMNRVREMLRDSIPETRLNAITHLASIHDFHTFSLFSQAMKDADIRVRNEAAMAFRNVCITVPTLSFRNTDVTWGDHILMYEMKELMRFHTRLQFRLRTIIIHTKSCHRDQVNAFLTHTLPGLNAHTLKRYVTVRIEGNPQSFCHCLSRLVKTCKTVDVNITTLLFGTPSSSSSTQESIWQNPDLTDVPLPLMHVTQVIIDAATCDPRLVERFLTYAVNFYDQKYFRKHVEVHLYGDSEKLHPNLRNSLTNLCTHVSVHEEQGQN